MSAKFSFIFSLLILLPVFTQAQISTNQENISIDSTGVTPDTLVAHYPFTGGAADSSGFGNDGEVFGAQLTEDRFGNANSAYRFDGDDYIDFGSSDSIEFGKNNFSFSLWIKPKNEERSQYQILRKGNDHRTLNEARWAIELVEDGRLRVIFEDAESEFNTLIATGEQELLDEKWHHIVGVFDRDSSLRVFVDNELDLENQAIRNYSGHITNVTSYNLYAGRDNTGNPAKGFSGSMDDIRIYSYALGEGAIEQLFEGDDNVVVSNRPEDKTNLPSGFKLYQNYPNPFNPTTQIKYDLKEPGFVELNVYDITGRRVAQLVNKRQLQGSYTLTYNASNLASGIYFYELKSGPVRITKKFTLIK